MFFQFRRNGEVALLLISLVCVQSSVRGANQAAPNWKDRQEYDLFQKITQLSDPNARLNLLNIWQEKYPQSDVAALRLKYYVAALAALAKTTPVDRPLLLDKCEELLKIDPNDADALYQVALWGPVIGGSAPGSELLAEVGVAANGFIAEANAVFSSAHKPANITDTDFARAKSFRLGVAHNALAWAAIVRKDPPNAEAEYKASLIADSEQGPAAARYANLLYQQKEYPEALFQYARAAQYSGPGPALTPVARSQLMDFFRQTYKTFHGSMDGADQVLAQAKNSALPPSSFSIASAAQKEVDDLQKRIASDPAFGLWYTIRQNLTGDEGDTFFEKTVKDALIPGGAQGVRAFYGTVISLEPAARPTKILLGVDDPTKPDAMLEFSKPLPASTAEKVKPGQKIEFSGVVAQYIKAPYTLIFKRVVIPGVHSNQAGIR